MLPAGNPVDIERSVLGIRNVSYICLVTLILILYDHLLTFRVELESFWTLGLTWLRALFFLNRYLSIILAAIQLYSFTSEELSASICAVLDAFIIYGTIVIVTFSCIVQFTRVYILYKPQRLVIYALMASMLILWGTFLGLTVILQRALIFRDDSLPALGHGCVGCRPSSGAATGAQAWKAFVPLLIQQTILAGMILFKGFTTPAKGEHAKGVMGVVMRDGAIVYIVILLSLIIFGATVKSLKAPPPLSVILLPVFSLCTTRLLVNLRCGPHHHHPHRHHNDLFAGVEMTGLYLGGYLGGIAPARGVEGAIVTEIGNTTIIEVPVVDLADDARSAPSRCGDTLEEGGLHGRPQSDFHASMTMTTTSPPLKVSALGARPGWERWDRRLPTKDFKLPSSSLTERGLLFEDDDDDEERRRPFVDREVLQQRVHHQIPLGEQNSARNSSARRGGRNRACEKSCGARLNSTLVGTPATAATTPTPPSNIPSAAEIERPGTSATQRTLVHQSPQYAGWPADDAKGGVPPKPPL